MSGCFMGKCISCELLEKENKFLKKQIDGLNHVSSHGQLEQRLSQAEALLENNQKNLEQERQGWTKTVQSLEQRLEQSEMKNIAAYANCNELNKRLSQAEAELQKHKDETLDGDCERCDYDSFLRYMNEKDREIYHLIQRLSHLMDVAGKMAGALERVVTVCYAQCYTIKQGEGSACELSRDALASWQDFNNKQGEAK